MHFTFPRCAAWPVRVILGSLLHLANFVCQFPPLFQGDRVLTNTWLRLIKQTESTGSKKKGVSIKHYPCTPISGIKRYKIIPYVTFYM